MSKVNSAISGAAAGASVGGPWGAAIGGVGGYLLGQDDQSKSYLEDNLKAAQNIPLPILEKYYPELYKQVVELNPELVDAVNLAPSAMKDISTDPSLKKAQMDALMKLQDISAQGGMTATDKARLAEIQDQTQSTLRGNTGAIQQNLASRGMSGGMSELVARQMAAQDAANRQASQGLNVKAQTEQRVLDAIMQSGQLGGSMQNQSFNQQAQQAQAQDAISRFNAQNLQDTRNQNAAVKNNAQQWNAQNAQSTANQNVGLSNQAQQYNANLAQQNFNNQLSKLGLSTAANNALASNSAGAAQSQDQFLGGLISAGGKYAASKNKQYGEQ